MPYKILADLVVVMHVGFILFAVAGGFLVLRWKRCAWIHIPAVLWAALIEFAGWVCPLTPLENWLREQGGAVSYETGFIDRHILPVLYPSALTQPTQVALGIAVLLVNLAIYAFVLRFNARANT